VTATLALKRPSAIDVKAAGDLAGGFQESR